MRKLAQPSPFENFHHALPPLFNKSCSFRHFPARCPPSQVTSVTPLPIRGAQLAPRHPLTTFDALAMPVNISRDLVSPAPAVSNHETDLQHVPRTLPTLCAELHQRITSFLEEETEVTLLKKVQEQAKISLKIAGEALSRYR